MVWVPVTISVYGHFQKLVKSTKDNDNKVEMFSDIGVIISSFRTFLDSKREHRNFPAGYTRIAS